MKTTIIITEPEDLEDLDSPVPLNRMLSREQVRTRKLDRRRKPHRPKPRYAQEPDS